MVSLYTMTTVSPGRVDHLDAALIELLAAEPRVGVLEASRRLRVARGTVQARLERLQERGAGLTTFRRAATSVTTKFPF